MYLFCSAIEIFPVAVTTANGIEVSTSYDLTAYDQGSLYKVVLVGDYACVEYTFQCYFSGSSRTYTGEGILIDQDSLAVRLVHN